MEFVGPTMGTRYMVKIYDPPQFDQDIRIQVDGLLRRINDQMSTYLSQSEVSRFNQSESTEWFEVSAETAEVASEPGNLVLVQNWIEELKRLVPVP